MIEDFEYEARAGSFLWNVDALEMSVFVVPKARAFNFDVQGLGRPLALDGPVSVEFMADGVSAYEQTSAVSDPHVPELDALLRTVASELPSGQYLSVGYNFRVTAAAFVYGFLHSQFQGELESTDIVEMLELSDGFVLPHSRPGEAVFRVDFQMDLIVASGRSYEVTARLLRDSSTGLVWVNDYDLGETRPFKVGELRWLPVAVGTVANDCEDQRAAHLFNTVGSFSPSNVVIMIPCSVLRERANSQNYGSVELTRGAQDDPVIGEPEEFWQELEEEGEQKGWYHWRRRVSLLLR